MLEYTRGQGHTEQTCVGCLHNQCTPEMTIAFFLPRAVFHAVNLKVCRRSSLEDVCTMSFFLGVTARTSENDICETKLIPKMDEFNLKSTS